MTIERARIDGAAAEAVARPGSVRLVVESMRPTQWIKNAFVLAGVIFAGRVLEPRALAEALAVTFAFCLASGATYLMNDVRDAAADRRDPRTASRPIARGALSRDRALIAAALTALAAVVVSVAAEDDAISVVAAYLALQVAYTYGLKQLVVVDVIAIAAGFVLRAEAGGVAIDVAVSPWLLVSTALVALFLGFAKRRGQVVALGAARPPAGRRALDRYPLWLLDRAVGAITAVTLAVYVAYAAYGAPSRWMLLTLPFVFAGMLRVRSQLRRDPRSASDPALVVIRDRVVLACVCAWAVCAAAVAAATT